jgi:hypothetical protein
MTAELPALFSLFSQSILVIPLNSVVDSSFFSLNQSLPQLSTKLTIAISDLIHDTPISLRGATNSQSV